MTRTELAHRTGDGIAVTLYWARSDNSVSVEVEHFATGDTFEIGVEPARALEAFYHPFGYAAARRPELLDVAA
jgi:hypothetical protein